MNSPLQQAIEGARDHLDLCKHALTYFERMDESSRKMGANIIIQSGRAVTYGFETLAEGSPVFRNWYRPHKAQFHASPIFKYFREVRNVLVHRSGKIDLEHVSTVPVYAPKAGAIEALVADGSTIDHMSVDFIRNRRFLVVRTPDGRREERDVPQERDGRLWELLDVKSYFKDAPPEFAGMTVVASCQQYVRFLEQVITEAERALVDS